jgi:hypothetical protein
VAVEPGDGLARPFGIDLHARLLAPGVGAA